MISGLPRPAVHALSRSLLESAGTVLIHHDLTEVAAGVVLRRVSFHGADGTREDEQRLELAHGCLSCTLREDVLPLLRSFARRPEVRRLVLQLDPSLEPWTVSWCLPNVTLDDGRVAAEYVRVEAVISVLQAANWLTDAAGDVPLREVGLAAAVDDERNLAQLVINHAEAADVIMLSGHAAEPWQQVRTNAVLDRIAPIAPRIHVPADVRLDAERLLALVPESARRGATSEPYDSLLPGEPPLMPDCGVALTYFSDPRPFHPGRFHEALATILPGTVRIRGRLWLATQPDATLWLETTGGAARVGRVGTWLAAGGWTGAEPERSALAAATWHPRYGDRRQEITVVAHDLSPGTVTEMLTGALLTDDELAAEKLWAGWPDPFAERHVDPHEDREESATRADQESL